MWFQWSQRPQTSGTEALALVLGYLRSSWGHCYRLSGSGVEYFEYLFYIDECGGHVCIVT